MLQIYYSIFSGIVEMKCAEANENNAGNLGECDIRPYKKDAARSEPCRWKGGSMALSDPPAERRQNAGAWIHHTMCLERNSFMLLEITALIVLIFLVRELRKK